MSDQVQTVLGDKEHVTHLGHALTYANRAGNKCFEVPARMPGIVIFIHGVNDTGAAYPVVEEGLCQGLNERLSRSDLTAARYGVEYRAALSTRPEERQRKDWRCIEDPDTYLYQRDPNNRSRSFFLPFHWGYRAASADIARVDNAGVVKSREADAEGNLMTRGQYQDIRGNRLDRNFGKGGGYFANATNNIPDMYGAGFRAGRAAKGVTAVAAGGPTVYMSDSPDRHYFILAATRLADLIRTIRTIVPCPAAAAAGLDPQHDTITIMGHSQGTIIALLAMALLKQQGQRCADCLIMVDTPYSVHATGASRQTGTARLKTLVDIVNAVTQHPYRIPELAELLVTHERHGGRAGKRWRVDGGQRPAQDGREWIRFVERDNRGKVYLYFCPEDVVVSMRDVQGIGTFGVPDEVADDSAAAVARRKEAVANALKRPGAASLHARHPDFEAIARATSLPAMNALSEMRFYQRMWTRMERPPQPGAAPTRVAVGQPPASMPVRLPGERLAAGPDTGADRLVNVALHAGFARDNMRFINGEALNPPCLPDLYGGEEIKGNPHTVGKQRMDDVSQNIALGNQNARLRWILVDTIPQPASSAACQAECEERKAAFNQGKRVDDQSANWRWSETKDGSNRAAISREETPNEMRARFGSTDAGLEDNNYHSAILRSAGNHRWVTAMDVAIGQAVTMDDPDWRELLMRMADWRLDAEATEKLSGNPNYRRLDPQTRSLLAACGKYYELGEFPYEHISLQMPPLVTSEEKSGGNT
ncbi:effector protein Tle3 domain-containing protein [Herbaspirillum robiniae]|uniref:DUF3274 domain-containing protein n=1 Tax=Herbaspirillum robiniae TaxID=2014887 RepID=A0A2D0B6V8_9BURK|nr:hypothetical protein CEJ42_08830 [Herbaspirillum robiniae]